MNKINRLIIGGARGGKSHFAQELALKSGKQVLFVATAEAGDDEMGRRIREHQKNRPAGWRTLEAATNIGQAIREHSGDAGVILVDCVTLLVNNIFSRYTDPAGEMTDVPMIEKEVASEIDELIKCVSGLEAAFIIVTNEVGMDLVPANEMGRLYRDLLGRANQLLAAQADEVYLMVAGLPVVIKPAARS
ncbi:MAG: bifunctional adenosylcobinamide kinase/adenosylcobinamide-phosphate guanylyltransferase [Dehalococcoidales bacterium]